jgi:hypothetical protein
MRSAEELVLDGNALAGTLSQVFVSEMTAVRVTCGGCSVVESLGTARLYRCAGAVLRCANCDTVLLRLVAAPDRLYLELTGIRCMELANLPAAAAG